MQAPTPCRYHGNLDKIQVIGEQHPSLGIDQHCSRAAPPRSASASLASAFDRHSAELKSVNIDLVSIGGISIR